ncbi:metallophosphoesterase [Albirhodobacter sp. R86504]|uniref:metallophosphoesterase n=1 Tax=Albirhodobacter sp. R86504 TaxID=3093848 RepID=UPI00366B7895
MWSKFRILKRSEPRQKPVPQREASFPPVRLDGCDLLAVIGDIHGMDRAFEAMLDRLTALSPAARIICVGDLIDRGEQSAEALRRAFELRDQIEVILGNHEEMLLRFLDDPEAQGPRWLRYGGLQCLASFGVGGVSATSDASVMPVARDALRLAMGPDLESWLRARPRLVQCGNVAVVHAGADPWAPISGQSNQSLTWGHPDFGTRARTDGMWVVHGHTVVEKPLAVRGVVSVDTGAYAGGGLTAALLSASGVEFVTVSL